VSIIEELFGVRGKSVLVTGGSRGIGMSIAEAFVKAGARVYISSRDSASCAAAAKEMQAYGSCVALPCDVSTTEGRQGLVASLKEHEKSLDILINNAGAVWAAPLSEYPESGWDKVFDLNVKGTFFLIKELVPLLVAAGKPEDPARIINVGSMNAVRLPKHETYAYPASKAALHHLTSHLASKLGAQNITANVIAPGLFPSKMLESSLERKGVDTLLEPMALKRLVAPSDMAGAAIYLASKAGSYVTGTVILVDGGATL
jgi:NAD(P)-dependent dehydrogenase (short-subunit alcohol dehydrogenase family)